MSAAAHARDRGPLLAVLLLAAFAYRDLVSWSPGRNVVHGVQGWMFASSNTSPLLVLAVSLIFVWNRRARIARALRAPRRDARGWLLIAPAAGLYAWSHYTHTPDLRLLSLVANALGCALVVGGPALLGALLLPAAVLLFAFPIPAVLLNQVVFAMQMWTADATAWALERLGLFALHHGDQIWAGGRLFEVIETCSGMGLVEAILLAAVVYGELLCRRRLHALLLVAAAPLVGFAVNLGRAVTLVLHPDSQLMTVHLLQGMVFLIAGVLALVPIEMALRRLLPGRAGSRPDEPAPRDTAAPRGPLWALVAVLAALALAPIGLPAYPTDEGRPDWGLRVPHEWRGWEAWARRWDREFLGTVSHAHTVERRYRRGADVVDVFIGAEDHRQRDRSFRSPKNAYPGAGWGVESRARRPIAWAPAEIEELVVSSRGGEKLVWFWYEGLAPFRVDLARQLLSLDASRFRDPELDFVIRLETPLGRGPAAREDARRRLGELAELVRTSLDGIAPRRVVDDVSQRP